MIYESEMEYGGDPTKTKAFRNRIAAEYYRGRIDFNIVARIVDAPTAQRLRLLKSNLEDESFTLATPDDTDIYDGKIRTVEIDEDHGSEGD